MAHRYTFRVEEGKPNPNNNVLAARYKTYLIGYHDGPSLG